MGVVCGWGLEQRKGQCDQIGCLAGIAPGSDAWDELSTLQLPNSILQVFGHENAGVGRGELVGAGVAAARHVEGLFGWICVLDNGLYYFITDLHTLFKF